MPFKILNRVRMSLIGAAGTGDLTLNLAAAGFQDLSAAGISDGDTFAYLIEDGAPVGSTWEIGLGTYHGNGTVTRTTVTQSSAGGTTKISVTANAILSSTLRAQDLMDMATTNPTVVQYKSVQSSTVGAVTVTLDSPPTPGNHLICFSIGGSNTQLNSGLTGVDAVIIGNATTAYEVVPVVGARVVRSGDGQTWTVGTIANSSYPIAAVLVEVANWDIANLTTLFDVGGGYASGIDTGTISTAWLGKTSDVVMVFAAGTAQAWTFTGMSTVINNIANSTSLAFAYATASAPYGSMTLSKATNATTKWGWYRLTLRGH